jgi:L-ascorbate metabolism protein UlaG (beta-lactamase superfamily)
VSHNHYDHLDLPALQWLAQKHHPLIVTTLGNKTWLESHDVENVIELDWWQTHQVKPECEVVCTPAQHFAARWPWDRCKTLWGGFALKTSSGRIYFTGDSAYSDTFAEIGRRLGPFNLALLPIGAYEPRWFLESIHMNPAEAVSAHRDLHSRQSLAMHFGTFQLTNESIDAPLAALAEARTKAGVSAAEFTALNFGETRQFPFLNHF